MHDGQNSVIRNNRKAIGGEREMSVVQLMAFRHIQMPCLCEIVSLVLEITFLRI